MTVRRKLAASVAALLLFSAAGTVISVRARQRTADALATLQTTHARMQNLFAIERDLQLRWRDVTAVREQRPDAPPLDIVAGRLDALQELVQATGAPPADVNDSGAAVTGASLAGAFPSGVSQSAGGQPAEGPSDRGPSAATVGATTMRPALAAALAPVLDSWRSALASLGAGVPSQPILSPAPVLESLLQSRKAEETRAQVDAVRFRRAIADANTSSLILVVLSLVAGVGTIAAHSITLTRGFARLDAASRHVGKGNYDFRLPVTGDDEFARASQTFNDMAAALAASTAATHAAREQAEESSATKSSFLTSLSHDLKTPLTAILGHADLIEAVLPDASPAVDDIRQLRRSARTLLAMVGELSDFARLEGGRMPVALDAIEPAGLVADVAATLRPLFDQRGNTFTLDDQHGELLTTDSAKLRHILLNLLGNACKFTRNGHIAVSVRASSDGGVSIEVRDSGIGMTEEEVVRVFAPYMQANSAIGSRFGGSGLGLAISKQFAELLGGGIVVDSTPGEGSVFRVTLPDLSGRALLETAAIPTMM